MLGQAAYFDGESGVRLADGLISSNSYSVSFWLKPEQLTTYTTTFFGARDDSHWVSVLPSGPVGGQTMVWSGSVNWYDALTGTTIPTEEWTHVALTVDEGNINVFLNGAVLFSGTDFPNIFTNTQGSFSLGVNWWDPPYKGLIDDLQIYEGALSSDEIAAISQ
nr:LamG domain-containing protein [Evansella halocellulosilytica]